MAKRRKINTPRKDWHTLTLLEEVGPTPKDRHFGVPALCKQCGLIHTEYSYIYKRQVCPNGGSTDTKTKARNRAAAEARQKLAKQA